VKVKMLGSISGARDGQEWPGIGEEVELPDDEAAALCAQGMAAPVAEKAADKAEKAVPADDAEKRTPAKKRTARSNN
jgi:hypothetical protein